MHAEQHGSEGRSPAAVAYTASIGTRVVFWLWWWLWLFGLWLVLEGSPVYYELLAGAAAAAIGATAAESVRRQTGIQYRMHPRWLLALGTLPWSTLRDTAVIFGALWRQLVLRRPVRGEFRVMPFDAGGDNPEDAARRGFVTAATSFTPNTYVVGIDAEGGTVLIHQLVGDPPEKLRSRIVDVR